nr:immunoglobulin light chain junction region [Macaca mulatta]MOX51738.1 immunoglobulin light chain junction region [Macaca mulatta]MOX51798.1 immunoglobulin light chain junction region [Macaca mulatta]MOX52263.1 immunoglobulin light chain junction region [Macaca mulatta]MOX52534.1 immunoglobulin light chain junction region [Macaca mulatta]
CLQYNSNPFTF